MVAIGSVEKIEGSRENVGLVLHDIGVNRLVESRVATVHKGVLQDELALTILRSISVGIPSGRDGLSGSHRLERERIEYHVLLEIISRIHCVETHCDRVVIAVIILFDYFNVFQKGITASPTENEQIRNVHDRKTRFNGTGEVGVAIGQCLTFRCVCARTNKEECDNSCRNNQTVHRSERNECLAYRYKHGNMVPY